MMPHFASSAGRLADLAAGVDITEKIETIVPGPDYFP
jgi:hypothetical protein